MTNYTMNNTASSAKVIPTTEIVRNTFSVLVAIFHMVGFILLAQLKCHLNQTSIIKNLALIEVIACLNIPILYIWKVLRIPFMTLKVFNNLAMRLLMMVLLADRFLEIYLNITYPVIITRGRVFKLNSLIWIASSIYGIVHASFATFKDPKSDLNIRLGRSWYVHNYITVVLDVVFTVLSVATYSYFYFKIRSIRVKEAEQRSNGTRNAKCGRMFNYKIPFMIVGSYLVFNVTSTVLYQTLTYKRKNLGKECGTLCELLAKFASFLQMSGYLSDAIFYTVMRKNVRKLIKRKLLCYEPNRSTATVTPASQVTSYST